MNLADLFQFSYGNKGMDSRTKVDGKGSVSGHVVTGNSSQAVKNLTRGQSIQGEIVGKNGNEVQIKIDKDVVITARLDKEIPVSIGQSMTFEVKNSSGGQVALRPLFENMGLDPNVLKALEAAKLPATGEFMQMVSAMMKQGMPIGKNALTDMGRLVMANAGANPETVVLMKALNLPVTPENIGQFENYQSYKHQLLSSVADILTEIPDVFRSMVSAGQGNRAADFYMQILNLFTGQGLEAGAEGQAVKDPAGRVFADIDGSVTEGTGIGMESGVESGMGMEGKDASGKEVSSAPNADIMQKQAQAAMDRELAQMAAEKGNATDGQDKAAAVTQDGGLPGGLQGDLPEDLLAGILDGGGRERLAAMLGKLGVSGETLAQVAKGGITPEQLMKEIRQTVSLQGDAVSRTDLMKLFGSREYGRVLEKAMEQQWLMKPEQVAQKPDVEAFYRRLRAQTAQLLENLGHAAKDTPLAKSLTNVQNNIDFMNQMNQVFQYVQLPLKMAGNEAHGDLYVYANRKNAGKEDGSVSALLHLDMEHLGAMDIHVRMKDSKVSTKFYLRDESIIDFIAAHIHILDERLQKRGYSFQSEMLVSENRKGGPSVIETLTAQERKATLLAQYSFDVRA